MRNEARVKRLFAVTVTMLAVVMSGCVSANVAPTVVSYNLAVEQAQNEMLLLNAVRAAKWQPMYVTDVAKVTGSIKRDLSATLAVPFGSLHHGTQANDAGGSGVTFSVNPTFEINTLNTTDFMKGFLQPIALDRFAYFWSQNWPPEFLLHLFVHQVDELQADGKIKRYYNHPRFDSPDGNEDPKNDSNKDLKDFSDWVTKFVAKTPQFATCERIAPVGPTFTTSEIASLVNIAKEAGLGIGIVSGDHPSYQIQRVEKELRLEYEGEPSITAKVKRCTDSLRNSQSELAVVSAGENPVLVATLHLRSPEDIIYYIGQIVRLETYSQDVPRYALSTHGEKPYQWVPIFVAFPPGHVDGHGEPFPRDKKAEVVVTDSDGDRYIIPAGPWPPKPFMTFDSVSRDGYLGKLKDVGPGMSNEVLSILTELIALHKSAKDFPSTGLVRTIGQ